MTAGEPSAPQASARAPSGTTIRIGTRGSRLARWQAEWVADRLRQLHPGLAVELVEIKTQGDRDRNSPLAAIGGAGPVHQGDPARPARRRGRGRRPQPEGPADPGPRGPDPGGRAPARGRGRRPDRPGPSDPGRPPRRGHGRAPARSAAGPSCSTPGPTCDVVGSGATSRPGSNQALEGTLDAVVLAEAGLRRLGPGAARHRAARAAAVPAGGGAGGPGHRVPGRRRGDPRRCSPRWTTRPPTAPSSPSAGPWPSWKGAA